MFQVHNVGWEFEYLNWIEVRILKWPHKHPPTFEEAINAQAFDLSLGIGTLSAGHFKRMQMEIIGTQEPRSLPPNIIPAGIEGREARFVTINNISIFNSLMWLGEISAKSNEALKQDLRKFQIT